MDKKKVVVTGGAGFIGSHIVEYWLGAGADVHIIDNLRTGFQSNVDLFPNAVFHKGSITDKELVFDVLKNADYVHHLAALISVPESVEKPYECVNINVNGLLNVLEAAKTHKIKKVVLSSSAAIYGDNPESPKTVNMIPQPQTPYGITKLDGEYYLQMYNSLFGLGTASLRYFNVFGPRQNPKSQYAAAVPIFISNALKNEPITVYGDGEQTRDFIFVKDVVKANVLAATTPSANGVFNVALGKATSIKELVNMIVKSTGSKSKIVYETPRTGDIKYSLASIKETVEKLGFNPDYTLEESIQQTIEFFSSKEK